MCVSVCVCVCVVVVVVVVVVETDIMVWQSEGSVHAVQHAPTTMAAMLSRTLT